MLWSCFASRSESCAYSEALHPPRNRVELVCVRPAFHLLSRSQAVLYSFGSIVEERTPSWLLPPSSMKLPV